MKMKYLLIFCLFQGLMSCSENKKAKSASGEIDIEGAIENAEGRRKADPGASGGNKCLLGYQTGYDKILSGDEVCAITGFSKEVMETKSSTVLKNPEHHSFEYRFTNGRIQTIPQIGQKLAMPDVIGISAIKAISLAAFESTYRVITDEEMKVAEGTLNDVTDGNTGTPDADAALAKAREKNMSKDQIKKTGGEMLDIIKDVSRGYRTIEGLGDAARWNTVSRELVVLQNGVQFMIHSNVSEDNEKNKSVAIELARIVLNKCK
jgi:hypothetical protein